MSMNFNRLSTDDKILIMEGAQVLGDVVAGEGTAFWYNSVCRGEMQSVRIGKRCNIQDLALIHNKVTIGDDVSVGHCATVHGATIGDRVIVGMGATVLDGAVIGNDCIIGAGALVTGKMNAPDGSMILGSLVVGLEALHGHTAALCVLIDAGAEGGVVLLAVDVRLAAAEHVHVCAVDD